MANLKVKIAQRVTQNGKRVWLPADGKIKQGNFYLPILRRFHPPPCEGGCGDVLRLARALLLFLRLRFSMPRPFIC